MTVIDNWFPGATKQLADSDGGSMLGGKPKCAWHSTETHGPPSYADDNWPHMTIDRGEAFQHLPANRAARALKNLAGGVQTNRWNVFQIEVVGSANRIAFHKVMREVADWLYEYRGVPRVSTVKWVQYDKSYGAHNGVRLTASEWSVYTGHLGHMHVPENLHGDPGWPFPIELILAGGKAGQVGASEVSDIIHGIKTDGVYNLQDIQRGVLVPGTKISRVPEDFEARLEAIERDIATIKAAVLQ